MNVYEAIFVARPALSDEEVGKLRDKIRGLIEKKGGTVTKAEDWGKRKLSFELAKEKKGAYLLFNLTGDGALVKDLERFCAVEDSLIRSIVVRADRLPPDPEPAPTAATGAVTGERKVESRKEGEAGGQLQ
jgi:small subunit ribosomal protein S6